MGMLTVEEVAKALPKHLKGAATQDLVDSLNQIQLDPEAANAIRENFISYSIVLTEGRFKLEDYMNAVAYVSFKLMGYNNQEAYARAFPQRHLALVARKASDKEISSYVSAFANGKLVTKIMEQAVIPTWLLHQDAFNKAIETQVTLMTTAKSEKVRSDAANSLLTHLKKPEAAKVGLEITTPATAGLEDLQRAMHKLVEAQLELIENGGATTRQIAHQKLVDALPEAEVVAGGGAA
jgi:hypothetical protein